MNLEKKIILLRYHEVALKKGNRAWFEKILARNAQHLLKRKLGPDAGVLVKKQWGRILVHLDDASAGFDSLKNLFGISSFSPIWTVQTDKNKIISAIFEILNNYFIDNLKPKTFRVLVRRSDKVLPENSMELNRQIGGLIKEKYPEIEVNLKFPEMTIGVEIRKGESYIWFEKIEGPGGLPVGSNAKVLALISGGIDSPVAAIRVLKRGSSVSFIHFHGTPFVGEEVLEKVKDLVQAVNKYQPDPKNLYVVPFGKIQEQIALNSDPKIRTLLYRRMMIRIACSLASKIKAKAIVTGESLGQVASQTVENIAAVEACSTLPVLRPLLTYDKDEIIQVARKLGTLDISNRRGVDCCTLFADRHPVIRATKYMMEKAESELPTNEYLKLAQDTTQVFSFK